jgi:hypothetical protein
MRGADKRVGHLNFTAQGKPPALLTVPGPSSCMSPSISQRVAGPGRLSILYNADISMAWSQTCDSSVLI